MLCSDLVKREMLPTEELVLSNHNRVQIVLGTEEHLEDVMMIQIACYDGKAPWGRIAVRRELRNTHTSYFLICYDHFTPIAFIGMSMRNASMHVTNIATTPTYQGQGVASFLIEIAIDLAKQLNRNVLTLEVRTSNLNAKRLYNYLGFEDGRIKRNYYQDNGEDALEMAYVIEEMDEVIHEK